MTTMDTVTDTEIIRLNDSLSLSRAAIEVISNADEDHQRQLNTYFSNIAAGTQTPKKQTKPRPAIFRALGNQDAPDVVQINGEDYHQIILFKHDSWAATGVYEGPAGKIKCKFNRQQPIFGIPMKWLGRWLGQRENRLLKLFTHLPNIPNHFGPVSMNGKVCSNIASHHFIEGEPLKSYPNKVSDTFFPELKKLTEQLHQQQVSYMDLNKQENIIVGDDGRPYLIDFQISFQLPRWWPANSRPMRAMLRTFQKADIYHVYKHYTRLRADAFDAESLAKARQRPAFIRFWRCIQTPLRGLRRKLLSSLGIRSKKGQAESEQFVEDAVHRQQQNIIFRRAVPLNKQAGQYQTQLGKFQIRFSQDPDSNHLVILNIEPAAG